MRKTILTFGLISGAISSLMMVSTMPFAHKIGYNKALVLGYTTIFLSFPAGLFRHPLLPRQHCKRPHHLPKSLRRRHLHHPNLLPLLRSHLGNPLFQFHAQFPRRLQRPHDRKNPILRRQPSRHPSPTPTTKTLPGNVRKPSSQRRHDLHRTIPSRPANHAAKLRHPQKKAQIHAVAGLCSADLSGRHPRINLETISNLNSQILNLPRLNFLLRRYLKSEI